MRQMSLARSRNLPLLAALLWLLCGVSGASAASPGLSVQAPVEGSNSMKSSVTISFTVTDFRIVPTTVPLSEAGKHPELNRPGEGHLHFMLDLQPLVVWDRSTPYTFKDVPPGDHELMVELANNDHASLSPRVIKQIHFHTDLPLPATGEALTPTDLSWWLFAFAIVLVTGGIFARHVYWHWLRRSAEKD